MGDGKRCGICLLPYKGDACDCRDPRMSDDLVARLRDVVLGMTEPDAVRWEPYSALMSQAASALEAAREENARLSEEVKAKAWAIRVIAETAQWYEKHLKEILCASDEVEAEDLQAHAGTALEEADWTDEEIAKARASLSDPVAEAKTTIL